MPRSKFDRPRKFEVYRANLDVIGEMDILVLSDDIINALRSVIVACSLETMTGRFDLRLPTYVLLSPEETGLPQETVASPASPFTLPKKSLVERFSTLSRKSQPGIDSAVRLAFGYEDWPF